MKRTFSIIGILVVTLLISAAGISCSGGEKIQAVLGSEFSLSIGQTALISSEGITLKFLKVESDNRCPQGVECVTAGEVVCRVAVNHQGAKSEISIPQPGGTSFTRGHLGDYVLLSRVLPEPTDGQTIADSEYKLYLTMSK